jgi:hypothetical protein
MKKGHFILITGFMFLVITSIGNPVFAGSEKFDEKMQPILKEYLKITDNLASDKCSILFHESGIMASEGDKNPQSVLWR